MTSLNAANLSLLGLQERIRRSGSADNPERLSFRPSCCRSFIVKTEDVRRKYCSELNKKTKGLNHEKLNK